MQVLEGDLVLSPSDLTGFAACEHLTQLELQAARGEIERAKRDDPLLDVLSRRGAEHETDAARPLQGRRHDRRRVRDARAAPAPRSKPRRRTTLDAMRKGVDVIYQATFFDGRWRGHADFLLRVDTPSARSATGPTKSPTPSSPAA